MTNGKAFHEYTGVAQYGVKYFILGAHGPLCATVMVDGNHIRIEMPAEPLSYEDTLERIMSQLDRGLMALRGRG